MEKTRILDSLNEQALLLPSLVNRALTATSVLNPGKRKSRIIRK
jgi:hypothetical protein